jgi:hypothetical protein
MSCATDLEALLSCRRQGEPVSGFPGHRPFGLSKLGRWSVVVAAVTVRAGRSCYVQVWVAGRCRDLAARPLNCAAHLQTTLVMVDGGGTVRGLA